MSSINSSGQMGNIISRLQGLKNVSGRKVMPGQELMQEPEYEPEVDLAGTAQPEPPVIPNFGNFITPPNKPEPDMGGSITSQSYDVRANTAVPMEAPQEVAPNENWIDKLGTGLKNYINPQPDPREQTMNYPAGEGYDFSGLYHEKNPEKRTFTSPNEKSLFKPQLESISSKYPNRMKPTLPKESAEKISTELKGGINYLNNLGQPQPISQEQQSLNEQKKKLDEDAMNKAQQDPYQIAAYGATDRFANSPELVAKFQEDTGIDFNPQIKAETEKYEEVLSNLDKGLIDDDLYIDEQTKRINERILNNQATDNDKYFIGLALAMPLILGGIFGKEAGLGALAGGAKNIAEIYKDRGENIREDEKLLADINKQKSANAIKKGELEIQRMEIPSKVRKNLPKDEYEDIKNIPTIKYTDPNTGETVAEGKEIKPDLVMNMQYGYNEKRREKMADKAEELGEEKAALERGNQATSNIVKAAMQLKDPTILAQALSYALADNPEGKTKMYAMKNAPMIKIDGRMQNSAIYLYNQIELLNDAYRRSEGMKALTAGVITHLGNMLQHPLESGMKPQDVTDQVLLMRDRAQNFFVDKATSQGFLAEPLLNKFGKLNRELYKGLNRKEELKELERDKDLMYGSE